MTSQEKFRRRERRKNPLFLFSKKSFLFLKHHRRTKKTRRTASETTAAWMIAEKQTAPVTRRMVHVAQKRTPWTPSSASKRLLKSSGSRSSPGSPWKTGETAAAAASQRVVWSADAGVDASGRVRVRCGANVHLCRDDDADAKNGANTVQNDAKTVQNGLKIA